MTRKTFISLLVGVPLAPAALALTPAPAVVQVAPYRICSDVIEGAVGQQGCEPDKHCMILYIHLRNPLTLEFESHSVRVSPDRVAAMQREFTEFHSSGNANALWGYWIKPVMTTEP